MPTNMPAMQGSAWLTQPIKDLVKNWKVDIASFLEDYVHEIEMVTISFDGGQTNLNFAEAALVIQGSACVYSRKVEYLYTLVYQMLDLLTTRKKKQQSSANSDGNHDNDASQLETTHHDEFLSLDDIPEKDTLDMKEDEMTQNTVHVIFRTPISLVPLAESEKGTTPLLSPTGEVLGNKSDFRLNTCSVHHQGIMLLDVTHLRLIETKPEEPNPGDLFSNTIADNTVRLACEAGGTDDLDMKNASDGGATMVGDCNDDLFDDDDPMVGILRDDEQVTVKVEPPVQTRQLRDRCSLRKQVQATPPKPAVNVYEPLDAYQADHIPEKPFKKGRTARIPLALQKAKSKRMPRTAVKKLPHILSFVRTCQQKLPKNPLHRPLCAEFTELFLTEQLKRKTRSKLRAQNNKDAPLDDLHQLVEDDQRELDEEPLAGCHDDEDDDDNNDMPAFASEDADNRLGSDEPFISEHTLQQQQQQQGAIECISSYEELVLKYTEGFLASAKEYTHMTELAKRVSQWEEKILPVLEQEETRGSFDIHKHGSLILDSFSHTPSAKVKKVPFKQIVSGKSTYDVCRYFLSALQLANSHNIEISQDAQGADGMDTMAIRLLSRKRIHEDLQEYRAPSLQQ